ncbi:acyltransferase family protein [Rhizobium sp. AG855]|uniref:acyltransferase family protein n=1 Tax=Rhizobium sp. AG855 TaxID=2183898 RepID=UPI000E762620|nr:acyltransferase family protein [Rhizobium sp. AG855]RKE80271.1 glucan biosynthesis protein C [Rhizobium sp. AG855]
MSGMAEREHHWDSLRALLMLLGIPYHAAMAYNTRVLWDVQSLDKSETLTFLSGFLVTFRMPAFFMVAGYFAAMLLARRPPLQWLRGRFVRLGVPFLTGLVLLAPPQLFFVDLKDALNGALSMPQAMHQAAYDVTHPGFGWIMHLWFLPALLAYSTLVALALALVQANGSIRHLRQAGGALAQRRMLLLPAVLAFAMTWEIAIALSHSYFLAKPSGLAFLLAHGVDPYLRYLPFFLLGVALRAVPELRPTLVWQGGWILPLTATAAAIAASLLRGRTGLVLEILYNAADGLAAILMSAVLIGCTSRFWNRPNRSVDRIVDASFTIYLLHHPLIYALVTLFLLAPWPPVLEFAIVCLLTLSLSYGAHRILRKSRLALFLFNGLPLRPGTTTTASATPVEGTLR